MKILLFNELIYSCLNKILIIIWLFADFFYIFAKNNN